MFELHKLGEKILNLCLISRTNLFECLKRNKVLYLVGYSNRKVREHKLWIKLHRRINIQRQVAVETIKIADKSNVRIMFIKTFKPFPYAPDDIDVLVLDDERIDVLTNALMNNGFFLRKKGTPEITLRKLVDNIAVDLDVHYKVGAGPYEFINKKYLWTRISYINIDNEKIPVPNPIDDYLIVAGHAVIKELQITLADIVHTIVSFSRHSVNDILNQAARVGLRSAIELLLRTSFEMLKCINNNNYNTLQSCLRRWFPYKVPLQYVLKVLMENFAKRTKEDGITPLVEIAKVPSSKGIGTLITYLSHNR